MFSKINEGEVASNRGFRVRVQRSGVTYFDEAGAVTFDAEHMANGVLAIYGFSSSLGGRSPGLVIQDVRDALAFLGVAFEFAGE